MERFRLGVPPKEKIAEVDSFIINKILPISIRHITGNAFGVLFFAGQDGTEECKYFQLVIGANSELDVDFIDRCILNIENIAKNKERLQFYNETIEPMTSYNSYNVDFDMKISEEHKMYYSFSGSRVLKDGNAAVINCLISKDNFIKINLFMNRLLNYDLLPESVFIDPKYSKIDFITINHIKLDACTTDLSSKTVCSHYTCGAGPTIFKFNYVAPKIKGYSRFKITMTPELYDKFYGKDFIVLDMIYEPNQDAVIVLFEKKSPITDQITSIKALVFTKEFYDKTNFLDLTKIYEEEEKKKND